MMERRTYIRHRIFAGVFLLLFIVAAVSYYFDLALFGRFDKGVLLGLLGVFVIYGCFFSPTRADMREHGRQRST